jgi:CMP/dCMP kinase
MSGRFAYDALRMIITIDGPAGTGKSTVARRVASELGFAFLDTGAMYRAIAYEAVRREANLDDARELAFIAKHLHIRFDFDASPPMLLLNGEPVNEHLRSAATTRAASRVAVVPAIRAKLVEQQRQIGVEHGNLVTEGRDQGSVVFVDAALKFYLDASPDERAHRRYRELRARGETVEYAEIYRELCDRDERDATRAIGALKPAEGAEVLDTTKLTIDQVVEYIVEKARAGVAS